MTVLDEVSPLRPLEVFMCSGIRGIQLLCRPYSLPPSPLGATLILFLIACSGLEEDHSIAGGRTKPQIGA